MSDTTSEERIIDEGLLIALSAVRMALKNHIIVAAARDHADFDSAETAIVARQEMLTLAEQNEDAAALLAERIRRLRRRAWALSKEQRTDLGLFRTRHRVHLGLAAGLRASADDEATLLPLVEAARTAASEELSAALSSRLLALAVDPKDPDYQAGREERIRALIAVDLAILADDSLPQY